MPSETDRTVTLLLEQMRGGDHEAADELLLRVYDQLHEIAHHQMRGQAKDHSLQTTALVNEAWMRVFKGEWKDREHFLAVASRAMRSVLVDHARRKRRAKRSADGVRVPLEDLVESYEARSGGLIELDAALERLAGVDPDMVRLVELRFFGGLRMEDVARNLGISLRTAQREWKTARAKLREELG